jgi:hypothetical protein
LLLLDRNGYLEGSYFTFSYSAISAEEGAVAGTFTAVTDTTDRVVGERRLRTLRSLAATTRESKIAEEACRSPVTAPTMNRSNIPFASVYLVGQGSGVAVRVNVRIGTAWCWKPTVLSR